MYIRMKRFSVSLVACLLLGAPFVCMAEGGVVSQLKALEDQNKRLEEKVAKLLADSEDDKNRIRRLTQSVNSISLQLESYTTKYWPLFINCGEKWEALYVAHALNVRGNQNFYFQVFVSERRSVQFDADGNYLKGAGHLESRNGCTGKSIDELRDEGRTIEVLRSKP